MSVSLLPPRGSSFRIKTNLSFLTLSDADISSLSFPNNYPGRNRLLPRVVATVPSKRKRPRRDENVVRAILYDESVRDENGPGEVRFILVICF